MQSICYSFADMLIKPTGRGQEVLLAWRQSLYQMKSGVIKDRTIEASLETMKKTKQIQYKGTKESLLFVLLFNFLSSDSLWILDLLSFKICT